CAGGTPACCATWQRTSLRGEVDSLTADPARPGMLLAGTASGLWASSDGGLTWRADHGVPATQAILSFASAPGGDLFAGRGDGTICARTAGPASAWRRISPPLGGGNPIFGLAYSGKSGILLAGTFGGVYRGERHGGQWRWRRVAATGDSAVGSIVWQPG